MTPRQTGPSATPPRAAAAAAPTSSIPTPGVSGGNRRRAKPSAPASRASAPQVSSKSTPPPVGPKAKQTAPSPRAPQLASRAGRNRPGQSHRVATAAPMAQSRQMLSSDSAPNPWSSSPSTAPAAQAAKQSSAKPSVSPSPKGMSAPYSTAQPPSSPARKAELCRRAGRTAARGSSAAAKGWRVSCLRRSCIKKSPLSGGDRLCCSVSRALCIYCSAAAGRFLGG